MNRRGSQMGQEEKDIRSQIRKFEDEIDESRLSYRKIEDEEQELEFHNASFHQVIDRLMADEQDEAVYWRVQEALEKSNEDYKKGQLTIDALKCQETKRQSILNHQIENCHMEWK